MKGNEIRLLGKLKSFAMVTVLHQQTEQFSAEEDTKLSPLTKNVHTASPGNAYIRTGKLQNDSCLASIRTQFSSFPAQTIHEPEGVGD